MKKNASSVFKKALPWLTVVLYLACCIDAFVHFDPHGTQSASFLSMIFSVLFFASCVLLLWAYRKSAGFLWFSLIVSVLSALAVICCFFPSYVMGFIFLVLLVYAPFYGLTLLPFAQQGAGSAWLFGSILVSMFIYKLVLFILLKSDFYYKKKGEAK